MYTSKHVNFWQAYRLFWKNYFNFTAVGSRTEYWWTFLWNWVIRLALLIWGEVEAVQSGAGLGLHLTPGIVLFLLYSLIALIPSVSLTVRRYRDAAVSSWWVIATYLLPYVLKLLTHYFYGQSLIMKFFDSGCDFLEFICLVCAVILPLFPSRQR